MTGPFELVQQLQAMEKVIMHMVAGYRVDFESFGEDGEGGYKICTENRWTGQYFEARGKDIREVCVEAAKGLVKP